MADMKRCTQCGLLKNVEEFRPYSYSRQNETKGRYRTCRSCEAINATYNRTLRGIEEFSDGYGGYSFTPKTEARYYQLVEARDKIEAMYELLSKHGMRVPKYGSKPRQSEPAINEVERLAAFYAEPVTQTVRVAPTGEVPTELSEWLSADEQTWIDSGVSPEYLQETVYESLKAKYRPQTGVNKETYLPTYDDTYKEVLNQILRKFDDYEERWAEEGDSDA